MTFSQSYAQARQKFLDAARSRGLPVASHVLPGRTGAQGEELATDTALIGRADAENLLIVTSGTHGVEGFCGSGCQAALIGDEEMAGRLTPARTAMLLVHAVNPWGFSHLRRTNEDNIDLNRNCVDFGRPRPANAGYRELDALLMPATWPPTAENEQAIAAYQQRQGLPAFQHAVSAGQYELPAGLFYGGTGPAWSQQTMRAILERHGAGRKRIGWIDIHTGLGPWGHGEKIFAGRPVAEELARAGLVGHRRPRDVRAGLGLGRCHRPGRRAGSRGLPAGRNHRHGPRVRHPADARGADGTARRPVAAPQPPGPGRPGGGDQAGAARCLLRRLRRLERDGDRANPRRRIAGHHRPRPAGLTRSSRPIYPISRRIAWP